jgi:hypothetical protein
MVARVLLLSLGLLRLKVSNFTVVTIFAVGLVMASSSMTLPIYAWAIVILLVYYGSGKED